MNDRLMSMLTQEWWLTVVFMGLFVNLAASYLKPRLDHFMARFSHSVRDRNESRRQRREATLLRLSDDRHAQVMLAHDIVCARIETVFDIVVMLGLSMMLPAVAGSGAGVRSGFFYAVTAVILLTVVHLVYHTLEVFRDRSLLGEARKASVGHQERR